MKLNTIVFYRLRDTLRSQAPKNIFSALKLRELLRVRLSVLLDTFK